MKRTRWTIMTISLLFAAPLLFTKTVLAEGPLPVVAAQDQQSLLNGPDAKLNANKKLVYDFWRIVLEGRRLDEVAKFMRTDYIQHNPNVETGMDGFIKYFKQLGGSQPIPSTVPDLISIQAESDMVTFSFVDAQEVNGQKYTTTWFDMFRIKDGKIAEHWDCAKKGK